jgi:histidine triad (HIT) family protein
MALELLFMGDCLFCKIIERKIPSTIVYEDDRVLAFNDIDPQAPTHVLIVPKRHIPTLNDIAVEDEQIIGELVRRAATLAKERGFSDTGYRTLFNTNRGAGQSVFHIHLHLLGGRPLGWPPG